MKAIDLLTQQPVPKGVYRILMTCVAIIGMERKYYTLIENENKTCKYIIECQTQGDLEKFYSITYLGLRLEFYRSSAVIPSLITEDSPEVHMMMDFISQVYSINLKYKNICYEMSFEQLMGGI